MRSRPPTDHQRQAIARLVAYLVKATPAADRRSGQETHNNPPALSRALERSAESVIGSLLSRGPS